MEIVTRMKYVKPRDQMKPTARHTYRVLRRVCALMIPVELDDGWQRK